MKISRYIAKFHNVARIALRDSNYFNMFITIAFLIEKKGYTVKGLGTLFFSQLSL